jgi:hypothetical protein
MSNVKNFVIVILGNKEKRFCDCDSPRKQEKKRKEKRKGEEKGLCHVHEYRLGRIPVLNALL